MPVSKDTLIVDQHFDVVSPEDDDSLVLSVC